MVTLGHLLAFLGMLVSKAMLGGTLLDFIPQFGFGVALRAGVRVWGGTPGSAWRLLGRVPVGAARTQTQPGRAAVTRWQRSGTRWRQRPAMRQGWRRSRGNHPVPWECP